MKMLENVIKCMKMKSSKNSFQCLVPTSDHVTLAARLGKLFPVTTELKTQEMNTILLSVTHLCVHCYEFLLPSGIYTQKCKVTEH